MLRRNERKRKILEKELKKKKRRSLKKGFEQSKFVKKKVKLKKPMSEVKKELKKRLEKGLKKDKKILESYNIEVDRALVNIKLVKDKKGITYNVLVPEVDMATSALIDEIREELVTTTSFGAGEITDPSTISLIKERFMKSASKMIRDKVPNISTKTEKFLVGSLMQEMLGLGKIEFLMNDPNLEEIIILNSKEPVSIYHKKYGWLKTNLRIENEDDINNYANIIGRRVGRQINVLSPLLDAHLITGDRVNAVLYPISNKGNTITIRKFARDPWTIVDLINNNTCNVEVAALLWLAIEYEMNIIFSGGTASGKTVFLNACMPFIPPNHRIISIEDTRELILPDFLYWCPLVTRTANPEGKGEVGMLDLLVNSLRMRPDRIVLGEIRRQKEAEVLFEAMHTGHSVYATVHADTAAETISRLINPPISIPPNLLKAVNLNVVMFRDRRRGIRRVYQIAEFNVGKENVSADIIYRWRPESDKIVQHTQNIKLFEDLSRHTGMNQLDIIKDLKKRKDVLGWLIKHNIRALNDIGKVFNLYYTDKNLLFDRIRKREKII